MFRRTSILAAPVLLLAVLVFSACGKKGTTCGTPNNNVAGTNCTVTWSGCSNGTAYQLDCTNTPPSTTTYCQCKENTVNKKSFTSESLVCSMAGSAIAGVANSGCGWDLQ